MAIRGLLVTFPGTLTWNATGLSILNTDGSVVDNHYPGPDIQQVRDGANCGSGSYYRSVRYPYLETDHVWDRGNLLYYDFTNPYPVSGEISGVTVAHYTGSSGIVYGTRLGNGGSMVSVATAYFQDGHVTGCGVNTYQIYYWKERDYWYGSLRHMSIISNPSGITTHGLGALPQSLEECIRLCTKIISMSDIYDVLTNWSDLMGTRIGEFVDVDGNRVVVQAKDEHIGGFYDLTVQLPYDWKYDQGDMTELYHWSTIINGGYIPGAIKNVAAIAYQESSAALPEVSANSIANVMDAAGAVMTAGKLIKNGEKQILAEAKKLLDPRNAWLSWRYVYNTTKMDLAEYKRVARRLINLAGASTFKTHGTASDGQYTCKCTEVWSTEQFDVTDYDTKRLLETFGFKLSAYNAWDMIPYSFMVDWVIPVGDAIEHMEQWNKRRNLRSKEIWFSISKQLPHGYIYYRWTAVKPSTPPVYTHKNVSGKTLTYRLADTVSIFSQ